MLSQANEWAEDAPHVEANARTIHEFVMRTSIPAGVYRMYNEGVPYSKSTTGKSRVSIGMLEDWSQCDKALAQHSGNSEKFRESEDVAFLEGMGQTIAQGIFYGNTNLNPAGFMGLAPYYNTINTANAANAASVQNGGGTGTSNTSLWMLGWGEESIFCVYPMGTKAGLEMENRGDTVPGFDSLGNPFRALTSWFGWQLGLCVKDWRYGQRLANLDVTANGLAGPNAFDLFVGIDTMMLNMPKMSLPTSGIAKTDAPSEVGANRFIIYGDRTLRHWMNVQAMRNRQTLLRLEDYAGKVVDGYRGVPIKTVDQLSNGEAAVV